MVKTASLYDNFCKTGNDVSSQSCGVVWSNFLAEKTSRTAAFKTDWSRCNRTSGAPAITELQECSLLANVNSRSRSLYAIARPSVVCLSVVCRLSVTFVRLTQAVQIFGNISTALG